VQTSVVYLDEFLCACLHYEDSLMVKEINFIR
jgi:hypothetical protein